jgi:hypothetical protein
MPVITSQKIKPATKPSAKKPGGSILSRAIPVADLDDEFLKFLIYGGNRVGKTTLACQFPKPLLLVSFEPTRSGGAKSVKKVPGVTYLRVTSSAEAMKLVEELRGNKDFKTHVWDSGTSYERLVLAEIIGDDVPEQIGAGSITREQYTERSEKTKAGIARMLELDANTVVTAKEKDHSPVKDQFQPKLIRGLEDDSFIAAELGGGSVSWLNDACDYITRLYVEKEVKEIVKKIKVGTTTKEVKSVVETGRKVHKLLTMLHPNFAAGFRSEHPKTIPECITNPTYEKIAKVIRGEILQGEKYPYAND